MLVTDSRCISGGIAAVKSHHTAFQDGYLPSVFMAVVWSKYSYKTSSMVYDAVIMRVVFYNAATDAVTISIVRSVQPLCDAIIMD